MGRVVIDKPKKVHDSPTISHKDLKLAKHVGGKLFELRKKNGIQAIDLSINIPLTAATVSRIERGKVLPTVITLWKLCKYFGVSLQYFFDGFEDNELQSKIKQNKGTNQTQQKSRQGERVRSKKRKKGREKTAQQAL